MHISVVGVGVLLHVLLCVPSSLVPFSRSLTAISLPLSLSLFTMTVYWARCLIGNYVFKYKSFVIILVCVCGF